MRPRFADVLDALDTAGFPATDLVVAWDFTVASDDFIHRDMIAARDRAIAALDTHPIAFTIATDAPIDDGMMIKRRITGTLDAPLFLTNDGRFNPGVVIARDADDLPEAAGLLSDPVHRDRPGVRVHVAAPVGW